MSPFNSSFRENQHDPVLQTSQSKRTTSKCHTARTNSALNYSKIKTHQIQQYIKLKHCGCHLSNAECKRENPRCFSQGRGERGNVKRPNEEKGKLENPWIQSAAVVPLEVWMFSPNLLGLVWYTYSNTYFQFLNNIIRIFTHFFIYTYFHTCFQTHVFSF